MARGRVTERDVEAEARRGEGLVAERDRAAAGEREAEIAGEEGRARGRGDPLRGHQRLARPGIDAELARALLREREQREALAADREQAARDHVEGGAEAVVDLRADDGVGELALAADPRARLHPEPEPAEALIVGERRRRGHRRAAGEDARRGGGRGEVEAEGERRAGERADARALDQRERAAEAEVADGAADELVLGAGDAAEAGAALVERDRRGQRQLEAIADAERAQEGRVDGVVDRVDRRPCLAGRGDREADRPRQVAEHDAKRGAPGRHRQRRSDGEKRPRARGRPEVVRVDAGREPVARLAALRARLPRAHDQRCRGEPCSHERAAPPRGEGRPGERLWTRIHRAVLYTRCGRARKLIRPERGNPAWMALLRGPCSR